MLSARLVVLQVARIREARACKASVLRLLAQLIQVRLEEAFPTQEDADLATLPASVGFTENAQLVFSSEPAPRGLGNDFWIGRDGYVC